MTQNQFLQKIIFVLLASACTVANPHQRKDAGTTTDSTPTGDAKPVGCKSSTECPASTPVCDMTGGICVQCTAAEPGICSGAMPYCGADNTCKACSMHSQCASNACLPDGTCSPVNNVAYVDPTGTGVSCTKDMPCSSLQLALETRRPVVKMTGTISDNVTISGQNVVMLADPGAKLTRSAAGALIRVDGSSQVSIYDLEVTGAQGGHGPDGCAIWMRSGDAATVSLQRVTLSSNDWCGATNETKGTLTIHQSTIRDNGAGLYAMSGGTLRVTESTIRNNRLEVAIGSAGTLYVSRSIIRDNHRGGILMGGPTAFTITNNFIVGNGGEQDPRSFIGAIHVGADQSPNNKIEFNTIVGNTNTNNDLLNNASLAGGIACSKNTGPYSANNNLIFGNRNTSLPDQTTNCNAGNSYVGPGDPGFVSPTDYHLSSRTPKDIVDKVSCPGNSVDIDGDPRPIGSGCDLGADEYKP